MTTSPVTYRGSDAAIVLGGSGQSTFGLSDFNLTLDKGTVEQELVGQAGNYSVAGSLSVEGSLTACKLDHTAAGMLLANVISGTITTVSGSVGTESLHFYFKSTMITGFDISVGDADTITEGSIDFMVQDPQNVNTITYTGTGKVRIRDDQ